MSRLRPPRPLLDEVKRPSAQTQAAIKGIDRRLRRLSRAGESRAVAATAESGVEDVRQMRKASGLGVAVGTSPTLIASLILSSRGRPMLLNVRLNLSLVSSASGQVTVNLELRRNNVVLYTSTDGRYVQTSLVTQLRMLSFSFLDDHPAGGDATYGVYVTRPSATTSSGSADAYIDAIEV